MTHETYDTDVVIVGGGPVGMGLAIELGQRGVPVTVIERYETPQPIPKGQNLTQRTMEHFHFWGAEPELRAARTVPPEYGIGGLTAVQLPPAILNIGLACFILWSVWAPTVTAAGRFKVIITGVFSSFLTMFFGATGSFVSAMVKSMRFGRLEHVATHSACMVAQHAIKVVAFGLLGFNYGPYAGLIVAMVLSGFLGTVIGKHVLVKMNDRTFHRVLAVLLSLLALRLLYEGVVLLDLF